MSKLGKQLQAFEAKINEFSKEYLGKPSAEMGMYDIRYATGDPSGASRDYESQGWDADMWPMKHGHVGRDYNEWTALTKAAAIMGDESGAPQSSFKGRYLKDQFDKAQSDAELYGIWGEDSRGVNVTDIVQQLQDSGARADYPQEYLDLSRKTGKVRRSIHEPMDQQAYFATHPQMSLNEQMDFINRESASDEYHLMQRWQEESPEDFAKAESGASSKWKKFWSFMESNPDLAKDLNVYTQSYKASDSGVGLKKIMKEFEKGKFEPVSNK